MDKRSRSNEEHQLLARRAAHEKSDATFWRMGRHAQTAGLMMSSAPFQLASDDCESEHLLTFSVWSWLTAVLHSGMSRGNAEAILLFSDQGPDSQDSTYFSGYQNNHIHNHNHGHTHHQQHRHSVSHQQKPIMNGSPHQMPQIQHRASFPAFNRGANVSVDGFPETQYQFMETAFGRQLHNTSPPLSHGSADGSHPLAAIPELRSSPASFVPGTALPAWVKPLPERINPDDAEFLKRKGALSVHDSTFRNELLKCFIRWVYPWSPVVNLDHVVRTISGKNPNNKMSLLLFQAMMFAGAGFADLTILRTAGFSSRKDARKHFFNRCKVCITVLAYRIYG